MEIKIEFTEQEALELIDSGGLRIQEQIMSYCIRNYWNLTHEPLIKEIKDIAGRDRFHEDTKRPSANWYDILFNE